MKPLSGRALNIWAAASLLVFIPTGWLWTAGHVGLQESADGLSNAFAYRGSVHVKHRTVRDFSMEQASIAPGGWHVFGLGVWTGVRADGATETWRMFHVWPVAALAAVLPVLWCVRHRRDRRAAARLASGQCVRCGYDCRATPGQCPECGTVPPPPPREGK
jgi:hypothetical protein